MRKNALYIGSAVVLFALILLLFLQPKSRPVDGRITLDPNDKIPYGCYVAYHLLQQRFKGAEMIINRAAPFEWNVPEKDTSGIVLFIVTSYFNPSFDELNSLTAFAQKGNTVFVSALQMNNEAQHFFNVTEHNVYEPSANDAQGRTDSLVLTLSPSFFSPPRLFSYPGVAYGNSFNRIDSTFTYPLGNDDKMEVNLAVIRTLKGSFILHTTPITLSNLFLLYGNNHLYYQKLLDLLPRSAKFVLWDDYFTYHKQEENNGDPGIFHVLLKYQNFRWAYWLALATVALYTLTEVKRRQRLQPRFEMPKNESLAFVNTIGKLYFDKGDHKNMAEKMTLYFLDFVRTKYRMATAEIDIDFAKKLSLKSTVSLEEIEGIMNTILLIRKSNTITPQQLMNYYSLLEKFYKQV